MTDPSRAYDLLQWVPFSLPGDYDEEMEDIYLQMQAKRSDKALDEWDKEHPYETSPELAAFHELETLGVFTQNDFYSPSKAKNGYYTKRLRDHQRVQARREAGGSPQPRRTSGARRYRGGRNQGLDFS